MAANDITGLAQEIVELESETFEISDYSEDSEVLLASTSSSSTSTSSSTCSTTSCSA